MVGRPGDSGYSERYHMGCSAQRCANKINTAIKVSLKLSLRHSLLCKKCIWETISGTVGSRGREERNACRPWQQGLTLLGALGDWAKRACKWSCWCSEAPGYLLQLLSAIGWGWLQRMWTPWCFQPVPHVGSARPRIGRGLRCHWCCGEGWVQRGYRGTVETPKASNQTP